jgi:hypothetical protein
VLRSAVRVGDARCASLSAVIDDKPLDYEYLKLGA